MSALAVLRTELAGVAGAEPLIAGLDDLDEPTAIAAIARDLDATFTLYRARLVGEPRPITTIRFYWAGAEIEPWVPSVVMGNVYVARALILDSTGGFDPTPMSILYDALIETPELGDTDAFGDLRRGFVAASVELARRAVAIAVGGEAFAALSTARPFEVLATPGHDTPRLPLLRLE